MLGGELQDVAKPVVALGAFGLQDDLPNRFFIQKVLEGGTLSTDSLANKLSDPRYAALAKAFGFVALVMASVNIFGGFLVTNRMLAMYKKKER